VDDVKMTCTYDEKDGRWRWLAEQGDWAKAGEEYELSTAVSMASQAVTYRDK